MSRRVTVARVQLAQSVLAFVLIVVGVALWSLPAALVVAGLLLVIDILTT